MAIISLVARRAISRGAARPTASPARGRRDDQKTERALLLAPAPAPPPAPRSRSRSRSRPRPLLRREPRSPVRRQIQKPIVVQPVIHRVADDLAHLAEDRRSRHEANRLRSKLTHRVTYAL